ncbi:rhodanese-like domain-containing protein [Streptomyces humi]
MKPSQPVPSRCTVAEAAEQTGYGTAARSARNTSIPLLLDVRELDEWCAGHVPGAVHLPLTVLSEETPLPPELRGRRLYVICRSGNRSRQAAALLAAGGADAVDVAGGMQGWAAAGLPVVDAQGLRGTVA